MELTLEIALVGLLAVMAGQIWRLSAPTEAVPDAPLSQATAVALALTTAWPGLPGNLASPLGLLGPLVVCVAGVLLVALIRRRAAGLWGDLVRIVVAVLVAGLLARIPGPGGTPLFERAEHPGGRVAIIAVLLLVVAVVAVLTPLVVRAGRRAVQSRTTLTSRLGEELGRHGPLALATATTAVGMALALQVIGEASMVLFLLPLLLLQPAVKQQRRIRLAQRQTTMALARLTEEAGLSAPGHAQRVARLAVPVAREAGVDEADIEDVETAALLHDIGQVGLSRPIPDGATIEVSSRDQRRIAATGGAILARTPTLTRLAAIVADVGLPHHRAQERGDVALASRVIRVVSAYDDLTGRSTRLSGGEGPVEALERILRNTPHEYDPVAVDALLRHLERRSVLTADQLARLHRPPARHRAAGPSRG